MFECTLEQGDVFRKIIASIQDLVTDGNFQVDSDCISLQGMDSSHVSLVNLVLKGDGFTNYRADRELTLGINFANLAKILKCMGSKDKLSIRAEDESDSALFVFESENNERLSNFELKLMDIDAEQLGIPDTDYKCVIRMPSSEFQRICRDLGAIGDTVTIACTKEGVKFSVQGEIGSGDMTLKQSEDENVDNNNNNNNDDNSESNNDEDETPGKEESVEKSSNKKKSEKNSSGNGNGVMIELDEPVSQTFALRYLNSFTKATQLSKTVTLSMGTDVPLVVEYKIGEQLGSIKYYLAPKIDDDEEEN